MIEHLATGRFLGTGPLFCFGWGEDRGLGKSARTVVTRQSTGNGAPATGKTTPRQHKRPHAYASAKARHSLTVFARYQR